MMELYPHQEKMIAETRDAYAAGHRVVVLQGACGTGKTACAATICAKASLKGGVIFLAPLDTLVDDTAMRLRAMGLRVGIIQAGKPSDADARIQVASVQTYHRRDVTFPASFVIFDEAHRVMARTYREIVERHKTAKMLLLSATPARHDGQPLGDVATAMVQGPSVRWLMEHGFLVHAEMVAPPEPSKHLVAEPHVAYHRHTPSGVAIVFCANRAHAKQVRDRFRDTGITASLILGDTPRETRTNIRDRVNDGAVRVIVGVSVFKEGFDLPAVDTVILATGFGFAGPYIQAIGRGLRRHPGKERCTVLDLRGNVHAHGLVDEDRRWCLEGPAVVRTEAMPAMQRCQAVECGAIFRPAKKCPRCGGVNLSAPSIPRHLNRAEKMVHWDRIPLPVRDKRYIDRLTVIGMQRRRMTYDIARSWALSQFEKTHGRSPTC